jgi:hypothetical protein
MENFPDHENTSYSVRKINQIIWSYNQLFRIFWYLLRDRFWLKNNDVIINIQRGLANDNNQIFWNYFWATHSTMWELSHVSWWIDLESAHRCIRFIFSSGKSITISTNSLPNKPPKWIVSLDNFYLWLEDFEREIFDEILLWINKIESEYFHSMFYQSTIQWIKVLSKDKILAALNVVEYPSN